MIWNCPYCRSAQVIGATNTWERTQLVDDGLEQVDSIYFRYNIIRCLNRECGKRTISCTIAKPHSRNAPQFIGQTIQQWNLLPQSTAKPLPQYIPRAIADDYYEACSIRSLSPKASATLSRRCLQGMIRDFCLIDNHKLANAIKALRKMAEANTLPRDIDPATLDAIDTVREIGNIGAHMEEDINFIVDVDPEEAGQLIQLLEMLFEDWYVAREQRRVRLAAIHELGAKKRGERLQVEASSAES